MWNSHPFYLMEMSLGSHYSRISNFLHENPDLLAKICKWKDGNTHKYVLHQEGMSSFWQGWSYFPLSSYCVLHGVGEESG